MFQHHRVAKLHWHHSSQMFWNLIRFLAMVEKFGSKMYHLNCFTATLWILCEFSDSQFFLFLFATGSGLSNFGRHSICSNKFSFQNSYVVIFGNGWSRRRVQAPGSRWWFLRWTTLYHRTTTTVAAATATCVVGRVVSRAAFHPPYALLHTPVGARRPTMLLAAAALLRICEGGGRFFCDPATSPQSDLFTAQ